MTLPAALGPWAGALEMFEPEFASALGPLVRRLDALIRSHDRVPAAIGEFAGWDGLTRRGTPDRLLASEWAVADAAPLEFLRRAVSSELLYLAPAVESTARRGRVAVLADTGPDQLGAPRLVQLATILVLHERATRAGGELILAVLGDEPGRWRTGPLERLVDEWLRARSGVPFDGEPMDAVAGWRADLEDPDELWLLTGARLGAADTGTRCVVTVPCAWDASGATGVLVRFEGTSVELGLPAPALAVRALRGGARRRRAHSTDPAPSALTPQSPLFSGGADWLLCRNGPGELVSWRATGDAAVRRHRFGGTVLSAGIVGSRAVALVERGAHVSVMVSGRKLAPAVGVQVLPGELELTDDAREKLPDRLDPLYLDRGEFLTRLAGCWWRLSRAGPAVREDDVVAVTPGDAVDVPFVLRRTATTPTHVSFGPGGMRATSEDGRRWQVPGEPAPVEVGDSTVLGVIDLPDGPALVTHSAGGLLLRLVSTRGTHTLTRISGDRDMGSAGGAAGAVALHPYRPWLAVRLVGRVEIVDLATDLPLRTVADRT